MQINNKSITIKRYSSGEMKLMHADLLKYVSNGLANIVYYGNKISFFELLLIIQFFKESDVRVCLTLAYLPYQRMDHVSSTHVRTVAYVARLLNQLGLQKLVICEPHCDISLFERAEQRSLVKALLATVLPKLGFDEQKDVLLFTDKGALNRYKGMAKHFVHCQKVRDPITGLIVSYQLVGSIPANGKVLIVDDIISTGDTLMHAIEAVSKVCSNPINIVCGHFEKNRFNKRLLALNQVQAIYASNSLTKREQPKLHLIDVVTLINQSIT